MYPHEQRPWILLPESCGHICLTLHPPSWFKDTLGMLAATVQGRAPPWRWPLCLPSCISALLHFHSVSPLNLALESRPHFVWLCQFTDAFLLVPQLRLSPDLLQSAFYYPSSHFTEMKTELQTYTYVILYTSLLLCSTCWIPMLGFCCQFLPLLYAFLEVRDKLSALSVHFCLATVLQTH